MDPISAILYGLYMGFQGLWLSMPAWVHTVAIVAAGYFINRALTPTIRDRTEPVSHPFGAQTTEQQGSPIQVAYGTTRVHANVVGHYLDFSAGTLTLNSKMTRHILACFGEGPWAAEPDDADMLINGRPLTDFPDVTTEWKLGLVDQTALTAWSTFRQDYAVGQMCLKDEPVTYTLTRTGFDDVHVILFFPKGLIHYGTDGDKHTLTVGVKVEVGDAIADTWQTVFERNIGGKTGQPCWYKISASGSYTGGSAFNVTTSMQPRVRVTRTTATSTNSRYLHDLEFAAVQVEKSVGFTHPGMVLLDLDAVPNEQIAGGITELSVLTTGKIVQDEDGNFAVSRYHADAIRDILTQPVIEGDGGSNPWEVSYYRGADNSDLVGDGWAAQKTLADTQVPDGNGNTVDMLRFDAVFSSSTSVQNAISQVGASGRCGLRCMGNTFGLWVDSARTPVGILCDGNWERDSFQLTPVGADELAAEASVRYRDADAGYAERTVMVIDSEMDSLTTVDIDLVGTTRTHEAARLARRELARNRLMDLTAECRMDIDGIVYEPGDVVYCQLGGRSIGGRVTAATSTTITVNRPVTDVVTGDDVVIVQRRDATTGVQELAIQPVVSVSSDGKTITVAGWDTTPIGDGSESFLFGPEAMEDDDQFEIIDISCDENLHVSMSLSKYVPSLDDLDSVAPDTYVPLSAVGAVDHYGAVQRRELPGESIDRIGTRGDVICEWGCYTFTSNSPGAGQISWATQQDDDGADSGYVRYGANLYQPADGDTSNTYVYWDPDSPNVFSETDDFADVVGKFLVAVNNGGTAITGFAFVPVDATSAIWANITGVGKPADYADVTADNQFATFQETFEDPNGDVATRWPAVTTSPGELSIESSGSVAGGKFLRIGNNSGNDEARLAWYKSIPFDPMRLYRLRFRIRRTAGSGCCYAGLSCRNAADNAYVAYDGSTSGGGVHWIAATARQPADWTLYTAYFKGTAATGDNTEHASPSDPAVLHENVRYIRPMFMVNYNDAAGTFDIDFVSLDILPEDADQIAESSTKKWAAESGADVTANHQDDINIDNIQDGSSYKKLSAANLAALESAINIDVPQPRSGWEGAFTNNSPSAGYVAWTSFVVRYKGTDYTVTPSNSNKKYIYWDAGATKTQLYGTDTLSTAMGTGKFIVGINDSGTFYPSQFFKVLNGALIQAATILAEHLSVSTLSAIAADLGTITSGSITMNLGSTYRLKLSPNGIQGSTDSGSSYFDIIDLDGKDVILHGTKLKLGSVDTDKIAKDAISETYTALTESQISYGTSEVEIQSISDVEVPSGATVQITGSALGGNSSAARNYYLSIYRDDGSGAVLVAHGPVTYSYGGGYQPVFITVTDTPTADTYEYTMTIVDSVNSMGNYADDRYLAITVLKR